MEAARSFVGLSYNPGLPSKGFLVAVAQRLRLPFHDVSALRGKPKQAIKPADIVAVRINATQAQNAIVTDRDGELYFVRPDQRTGKIVEHILDQRFRDRILQAFELSEGLADCDA
jgi:hypothetical protein